MLLLTPHQSSKPRSDPWRRYLPRFRWVQTGDRFLANLSCNYRGLLGCFRWVVLHKGILPIHWFFFALVLTSPVCAGFESSFSQDGSPKLRDRRQFYFYLSNFYVDWIKPTRTTVNGGWKEFLAGWSILEWKQSGASEARYSSNLTFCIYKHELD